MMRAPLFLKLPIGDVADLLGIPQQTINSWRNAGLLPGVGEFKGANRARLYGFGDMTIFAAMRDLTTGPAGISGTAGAEVALRCRGVLLDELAGFLPQGSLLAVEAGTGVMTIDVTTPDGLVGHIARWRQGNRASLRTRLEIVDVDEIALRTCTKLTRFDRPEYGRLTEDQVRVMVEPAFHERAAFYLRDEIEAHRKARADAPRRSE